MRVLRRSSAAGLRRLAWHGPLLTSPDEREHRTAMARAAVYLYLAGATLGALTLLFPSSGRNATAVAATSVVAYLLAGLHLVAFERLPFWAFQASGACASALITAAVHFGGETGGPYRPLYLCVVFYAVFFYDVRAASIQLALVAAGYAFLVTFPGAHGPAPAHALIAVATLAIAGVIVFVLKRRLRALVEGLASGERRYRNLVEQLPLTTYVDALDELASAVYVSPQIEQTLGYAPEEWLADPELFGKRLHPDDRERVLAEVDGAREGSFASEYRLIAQDGRVVWIRDESIRVETAEGPSYAQGYMLDITHAKDAEAALRMSEERFRALVANVPGAIFRCENEPPWTMEFVSDAIEAITGYPASDFIGNRVRTYGSIVHPDDRITLDPEVGEGQPYEVEYRIAHADGSVRCVFERGQGVLNEHGEMWLEGVIFDITERKQAEELLNETERRNRTLVEQLPLVTYVRGLEVLESNSYASPQVQEVTGHSVEQWQNEPDVLAKAIHPDDLERVIAECERLRETGEPITVEYRFVRPDGRVVWVRDGTMVVRDEHGRPSHVQGYLLDITQAKAAEAALRMSEQRFRALVANVPGAIFRSENESPWTMEFVSDAIEEITGYPASEFIGNRVRTYGSIIHRDDSAGLDPELAAGRPYEVEYRIVHADGSLRWVFERGQGVPDEHGNLWLEGVIFDITERKQAEERLAETERRNRTLVEQLPLITYIAALDDVSSTQYVSPQIEQILGYPAQEWLDDPDMWVRLLHPDDRERVLELHRTLPIDQEFDCEYRLIAKDGRAVWLHDRSVTICDDAGNPLHSQGYVVDITEARRAQEDIVSAKEFSETLIRTANVMVVGLDLDGRVTLFNEAAEQVTGYSFEELRGRPWFELVAPGDRSRSTAEEADESPILTKSGEERFVSWRNSEARENGRVTGTISFGIDITERKGLEDQLRQSQKMEAVGRLAGGIAHDFNNLLTAISGYSDFALANVEPGGAAAADIGEISKAAERASSLTRQLLAFSRRQVLQPRILSLNEIVGDLEGMLRRLIGENIRLQVTLDPGLDAVRVDRGQIEQVLMNLTLNARDAMPDGGDLLLTTRNVEVSGARAETALDLEPGSYAMLVVSDTGHGMDAETRSRAFEPFFTTKKPGEGTGLGLATVYGIVRQSGGSIRLDSTPGKGAVLTLYFPRAWQAEEHEAPALAIPEHANGSETILLVEDEDVVRDLVRKMLEQGGYTILEARDGREALALSKEHVAGIDLLLTDVVMPGMNGRELAERIWFARPETRVLYMSGYTDSRIFDPEVLDPGSAFLHKPFTYAELAGKVREVLDTPRPEMAA